MANYPINIWVIDENEFDSFTCTGGKVVYITEEPDIKFATHPAIITAGALLPPVDAIQAELDGNILTAVAMYEAYLMREEATPYISILIAAGLQQIPIGIMFGKDEMNMQFPKMFIDALYKYYGMVLGIVNKVQPYIDEEMMPFDLARLYVLDIIDHVTLMTKHPRLPLNPMCISKLAYELNPVVDIKDMEHYAIYFENMKNAIVDNGGRYLVDPLEAI